MTGQRAGICSAKGEGRRRGRVGRESHLGAQKTTTEGVGHRHWKIKWEYALPIRKVHEKRPPKSDSTQWKKLKGKRCSCFSSSTGGRNRQRDTEAGL